MWFLILLGLLAVLIYSKLTTLYRTWADKEVHHVLPWPLLGNMSPYTLGKCSFTEMVVDLYNSFPQQRYMGLYQYMEPALLIRDPDLIKKIKIKDFDTFPDRRSFGSKEADPLWARNVAAMTSKDGWHDMRSTLSPVFTSSKLKAMFVLMQQCAEQFTAHFRGQGRVDLEMFDAFTRFANDIIATTAFGFTCDSLKDPENIFFRMGKDATDFSGVKAFKFLGHSISPLLMKMLKITIFSQEASAFFRKIINEAINIREEKQIVRPDLIHLLMEARKGRLKYEEPSNDVDSGFAIVEESTIGKTQKRPKAELSDDDIVAQGLIFFAAGFESTARLMSFVAHELAVNSDVEEKLIHEVDATVKQCNGKLSYEALLGMKYLDMVVSETLRKWPGDPFTERKAVKPFTIEPEYSDEKPLHLDAGTLLWFPVYAIHNDPKHYENPKKFDPERFNDENKHNIKPFTYIPFGAGPRSCIASRFALLETKLIIAEILRSFEFVPMEKTQIPIKLDKKMFGSAPEGGFWLGLQPRRKAL